MVGIAQLASAPDCGSGGPAGSSPSTHPCSYLFIVFAGSYIFNGLSPTVRHRTLTPVFAGPNPASPVILKKYKAPNYGSFFIAVLSLLWYTDIEY